MSNLRARSNHGHLSLKDLRHEQSEEIGSSASLVHVFSFAAAAGASSAGRWFADKNVNEAMARRVLFMISIFH